MLTEVIVLTLDIKDEQDWQAHHWASDKVRHKQTKDCTPIEYIHAHHCSILVRIVLHGKSLVDALASINIFQTFFQTLQYFYRAVRFATSHTTSVMGKLDPTALETRQ